MALFGRRVDARDALIATLRAELSDLRQAYQHLQDQSQQERRDLLDRLLAVTQPQAIRELRRTAPGGLQAPATPSAGPRFHYPGSETRILPPYPPDKPEVPLQESGLQPQGGDS